MGGPPPIVAIVGSTATGKSTLALALAEALSMEVVNADAMQFYRGMDIGTAKLTVAERRGIPHHQIDTLDVTEDASVARYQTAARATVADLAARGRRAVVVGGSGLYIRALLDRMHFPGTDPEVRARLEARADTEGPGLLFRDLLRLDPEAAARIGPHNARRLIRALEVIALTGEPYTASLPARTYEFPALQIGLRLPYAALDPRIDERTRRMFDDGLVEETQALVDRGLRDGTTARRAVGYAEALVHLDGGLSASEARDLTAQRTRRLARRQARWFVPDERVRWIDAAASPEDERRVLGKALAVIGTLDA